MNNGKYRIKYVIYNNKKILVMVWISKKMILNFFIYSKYIYKLNIFN